MDSGKQQQILGYFLEEAKEHLDTIEKGLLDLQATVADQERVNELFRAAHSVKGGAAMLGFGSIQKTAHRLEDCFKILKENQVKVDQKIETLFLKGFDALEELLERLQGPFGLRDEEGEQVVQKVEPIFGQLQDYLNSLVSGAEPAKANSQARANFGDRAIGVLKQMLQLFKEKETPANRKQLVALCAGLAQLDAGAETWPALVKTAQRAISHPQHSYRILAPFVIKELKQASDLVVIGKAGEIAASYSLQQLAAGAPASGAKEILVVAEPKAAAQTLIQTFNREQLSQLVELLRKAIK
ncbi:Hpt domain-containing protein [Kamptonema formosum]|uniref:Hpt domain-containing protein n=1 Tax=Kamptonema formosum TaxID=331992 RepID=UPI000346EEFA|nr:Hpt domain-containing protein [Oscillatoria sp. PCC 10802]